MRRSVGLLWVVLVVSACARPMSGRVAVPPEALVETRAVRVEAADFEACSRGVRPGIVSSDQAAALLRAWEAVGAEDISSGGSLLALDGQEATLFVGEVAEVHGQRVELGQRLAVSVTVHPHVDRITLDYTATWRRLPPESGGGSPGDVPPRVEEHALRSRTDLPNGGWLLLTDRGRAGDAVLALVHLRLVAR